MKYFLVIVLSVALGSSMVLISNAEEEPKSGSNKKGTKGKVTEQISATPNETAKGPDPNPGKIKVQGGSNTKAMGRPETALPESIDLGSELPASNIREKVSGH